MDLQVEHILWIRLRNLLDAEPRLVRTSEVVLTVPVCFWNPLFLICKYFLGLSKHAFMDIILTKLMY